MRHDDRHDEGEHDAEGAELEGADREGPQCVAVVRGLVDLALLGRIGGAPPREAGPRGGVQHEQPQHDGHEEVAQRQRRLAVGRGDEVCREEREARRRGAAPGGRHRIDADRDEAHATSRQNVTPSLSGAGAV